MLTVENHFEALIGNPGHLGAGFSAWAETGRLFTLAAYES